MAALMDIGRLSGLLGEAAGAGCRLAWVENGALMAGPQLGQARFVVDFAHEKLVRTDAASDDRRPPRDGPDVAVDRGPEGEAARRRADDPPIAGGRRTGDFSLILEGGLHHARSQRELLRVALQAIERARPGTLEKLSAEKGRTKRPVARRREQLYDDAKLSKHADEIEGGWWIATNNSYPEVEKFIRRAAWHAGLHVELRRSA